MKHAPTPDAARTIRLDARERHARELLVRHGANPHRRHHGGRCCRRASARVRRAIERRNRASWWLRGSVAIAIAI